MIGDDGAMSLTSNSKFCGDHSGDTLFIHGNRDFNNGRLPSIICILVEKIAGPNLIVIHGDELCTNDKDYQEFRNKVRPPAG